MKLTSYLILFTGFTMLIVGCGGSSSTAATQIGVVASPTPTPTTGVVKGAIQGTFQLTDVKCPTGYSVVQDGTDPNDSSHRSFDTLTRNIAIGAVYVDTFTDTQIVYNDPYLGTSTVPDYSVQCSDLVTAKLSYSGATFSTVAVSDVGSSACTGTYKSGSLSISNIAAGKWSFVLDQNGGLTLADLNDPRACASNTNSTVPASPLYVFVKKS
ncbi:MAG: hypothetical protein JWQ35_1706 [Bacteriovoracaceae bacterium]|nr:hypothetical protein [Bacteriovoracaceae bacterium]